HGADRLGRAAVRCDHALRGPRAGAARPGRGGRGRRRATVAHLPRHHAADPPAGPAHPHEPLDHLGLRRLHAAVPADRPVEDHERELPDEHLSVRGGLLQERLRPRRRDLDPDAADGRGPERRVRPQDGAHGGGDLVSSPRRARRARQAGWNTVGLAVFVVMVFPVFWMISTAFKTDDQIIGVKPTWFPLHPTLSHFRAAIDKPFFWADVKNSLIVVSVTVVISIVLAF